ncbi:MAG: hypothetical protein KKE11_04970 [Gammaproteobacteria bacterium]|nr:hypothetical protein [Gammaproteobacteria bacterium]
MSDKTKKKKHGNGSPEHYNAILLEDIRAKMEFVIEKMQVNQDASEREIQLL